LKNIFHIVVDFVDVVIIMLFFMLEFFRDFVEIILGWRFLW